MATTPGPGLRFQRFASNPAVAAQLLTSPSLVPGLTSIGARGRAAAQRRAPRRGGYLADGIDYEVGIDRRRRALVLRLFGSDFKTGWYEFGTVRNRPVAMLRRGLDEAAPGLKWGGSR
jgi:hypothetical protein